MVKLLCAVVRSVCHNGVVCVFADGNREPDRACNRKGSWFGGLNVQAGI
jgi:hypothetical protein